MKLIHVVGARPNFMKIAPIIDAIHRHNRTSKSPIRQFVIHTGQHYDEKMSQLFFDELNIPKPDVNLEVGSASHAEQTAEIMKGFERVCLAERPTHILVVGDVNSTIACALVASKLGVQIIHVEAGLRSFNRSMPEEINRVLTDALADYLFITEKSAKENLIREGISKKKIFFVGNVMIDTLLQHREKARSSDILNRLELTGAPADGASPGLVAYGLLTLHRPSNVDDPKTLRNITRALVEISKTIPVVFPVHPRTRMKLEEFGLKDVLVSPRAGRRPDSGILTVDPLGYLDFLCLMTFATLVLTDSGGIQEETTALGVPCVTIREETERPVTVTHGTNVVAGTRRENIIKAASAVLNGGDPKGRRRRTPPLWDGKAADRIVKILSRSI